MTKTNALSVMEEWHDEYVAIRRDLHAHPEIGFDLPRTAQIITDHLKKYDILYHDKIAQSGVVAVIQGRKTTSHQEAPPRAIGLRADMDALLMSESNRFSHASKTAGRMHGCGHDGHTAMLLCCARYLAETRDFSGTAYCIFQPAEEGAHGCKTMIEEGLLERFPMDYVFALHNWPQLAAGKIAVRSGAIMASCDKITIDVEGVGGHGAMPHLAVDPVLVAAHIIVAAQSIVARSVNPLDSGVVSLCAVQAGHLDTMNVLPHHARLVGTTRAFSEQTRNTLKKRLEEVVTNTARAFGATARLTYEEIDHPTINDPDAAAMAYRAAVRVFGEENIVTDLEPSMGAEDFSFLLKYKKGAYLRLGQADANQQHCRFLHNDGYDFNDTLIPFGAAMLAELVVGDGLARPA